MCEGKIPLKGATLILAAAAFASATEVVGKADAVYAQLAGLAGKDAVRPALSTTVLPTAKGGTVSLEAMTVDHDTDGYVALWGGVAGDANGDFLFKGNPASLYGWVLTDGHAYEYHVEGTDVVVDEVDMEAVRPSVPDVSENTDHTAPDTKREASTLGGQEEHEKAYSGQDLRRLQSRPGAKKVILLDYKEMFENAAVNDNIVSMHCTKEDLYVNWQIVAAGLSMFDVNVVTDRAVYNAASLKDKGLACYFPSWGRPEAPLHSFGSTRCSRNYPRPGGGYTLGRQSLQEIGHQLGLRHDGTTNPPEEMAAGLPLYRWVPIMGNFFKGSSWGGNALYQWSKGEYDKASNRQNDLLQIGRYLPRLADDIRGSVPLLIRDDRVDAAENRGQIENEHDSDRFVFRIGAAGGRVDLTVDRTEHVGGAMLDVDLSLVRLQPQRKLIRRTNPLRRRSAEIKGKVASGVYELIVRGGAEGTPMNGFSRYSSLGRYAISGSVTGAVDLSHTPAPPTPVPQPPCTPLTEWFNNDNPGRGGDFELVGRLPYTPCGDTSRITGAQCQRARDGRDWTKVPAHQTGKIARPCSKGGFVCLNRQTNCADYRVRFTCNCPTS